MNKNGLGFEICEVCQFKYIIELVVTRDITLIILLIQAIIIGMTFILQAADKKSHGIKNLYPDSMSAFGVYYLNSLILLFALLGLFGFIALCCGLVNNNDDNRCDCDCARYPCICISLDCNGCEENDNCDGKGADAIVIVIVLIFAIIGVFVGIMLSVMFIRETMKRHTKKLWLRQEAKKYVVKDFQGRRNELLNMTSRYRYTNLPMDQTTHRDKSEITPSAPIELLQVSTQ
ncbi:unnamed protein product [Rotaria sordida]|uniref:Uncharacterized protein n=1 Tax=Rotaria sordida TaxID=392033 RepID=A0A819E573_9BILA|nr:unnamed protein product [Rotaria sordida]